MSLTGYEIISILLKHAFIAPPHLPPLIIQKTSFYFPKIKFFNPFQIGSRFLKFYERSGQVVGKSKIFSQKEKKKKKKRCYSLI